MALHLYDALAKTLNCTEVNKRHDFWLWFYLNDQGADFDPSEFDGPDMRDRMAHFISNHSWIKQRIAPDRSRSLLPDERLAWITKDERLNKWLHPKIRNAIGIIFVNPPPGLLGRSLVITMIDVWDTNVSAKMAALDKLERSWGEHKKQDHIFRWFNDKDGAQRCSLAWEWLRKNEPRLTEFSPQIESYGELLKFFDQTHFSKDEKILRIEIIKKRWSQQQYRERMVGKKQFNVMLSDETIDRLDALAETYNLKRPQILEVLIQMEAENSIYIPERLKVIRSQ